MRRWRLLAGVLTMLLSGCASQAAAPRIPLAHVDMSRMYGGWYIIATIPNWFEKGMVAPYDVYARRPDGDIREDFYCRRGGFHAPEKHFVVHDWVTPNTNNAAWRVQVFWPINLPFLVLYTDPQYRFVLFGEQNRKLGWIYARTPTISDADYHALLARFQALGYNPVSFVRFIQIPEQINRPSYWSQGVLGPGH